MIQALEYIELHRTKALGLLFPASFQPWRRLALLWLQMHPGAAHRQLYAGTTIEYQTSSTQIDSAEPLLPQHIGSSDMMAQVLQQRRNFEPSQRLFLSFLIVSFIWAMLCPVLFLTTYYKDHVSCIQH